MVESVNEIKIYDQNIVHNNEGETYLIDGIINFRNGLQLNGINISYDMKTKTINFNNELKEEEKNEKS